jgi:hypothetical protein
MTTTGISSSSFTTQITQASTLTELTDFSVPDGSNVEIWDQSIMWWISVHARCNWGGWTNVKVAQGAELVGTISATPFTYGDSPKISFYITTDQQSNNWDNEWSRYAHGAGMDPCNRLSSLYKAENIASQQITFKFPKEGDYTLIFVNSGIGSARVVTNLQLLSPTTITLISTYSYTLGQTSTRISLETLEVPFVQTYGSSLAAVMLGVLALIVLLIAVKRRKRADKLS